MVDEYWDDDAMRDGSWDEDPDDEDDDTLDALNEWIEEGEKLNKKRAPKRIIYTGNVAHYIGDLWVVQSYNDRGTGTLILISFSHCNSSAYVAQEHLDQVDIVAPSIKTYFMRKFKALMGF